MSILHYVMLVQPNQQYFVMYFEFGVMHQAVLLSFSLSVRGRYSLSV